MQMPKNIFQKVLIILWFQCVCFLASAQLPDGFVYVKEVIPDIEVSLSYYSTENFVGDTIAGYRSNKLILSTSSAMALAKVQAELRTKNLCLLVFDGYRPQTAVNHFVSWAKDLNDTLQKSKFYPKVEKRYLFRDGYIASRSGHSRGSTVDLSIIDGNTGQQLDMGTPFDFFGLESAVNYQDLSSDQKANRAVLQNVMQKHGFRNYPQEWWHFTLRNEPFPDTYFDFFVE